MKQRITPVKARAVETRELLLSTARTVLDEVGFEGLTTALVADRAGVNIATLYRYFEDKAALVATLAERDHEALVDRVRSTLRESAAHGPFEQVIGGILHGAADLYQQGQSRIAVRQALNACPSLWPHDLRAHIDLRERCAVWFRREHPAIDLEQARAICDVCTTGAFAVLEMVPHLPLPPGLVVDEMSRFVLGYVNAYRFGVAGPRDVAPLEPVVRTDGLPLPLSHLRRAPVQRRAVEAVESILAAAMDLLQTVGYEGLTTALVAERAGVNIATVYRYFVDKASLVKALAEQYLFSGQMTALIMHSRGANPSDWREYLAERLRLIGGNEEARQRVLTLWRAMQADPELNGLRLSWPIQRAQALAEYVDAKYGVGADRSLAVAIVLLVASVSVLMRLDDDPDSAAATVAELTLAVEIFTTGL